MQDFGTLKMLLIFFRSFLRGYECKQSHIVQTRNMAEWRQTSYRQSIASGFCNTPIKVVSNEKQSVDEKLLDSSAHILVNAHYQYADAEANAVWWKRDLYLMTALLLAGVMLAVDKIIISNAALHGMKTDLHLTTSQYSWVGSIVSVWVLGHGMALVATSAKTAVVKTAAIHDHFVGPFHHVSRRSS